MNRFVARARHGRKSRPSAANTGPTLVLFALLLASWQLAVSLGGIREYLPALAALGLERAMARRHRLAAAFVDHDARDHRRPSSSPRSSASRWGVAIAWSPLMANALVPFLVFVNTLPKVAIAPLVPDLDGLRHLAQHADGGADRLLSRW